MPQNNLPPDQKARDLCAVPGQYNVVVEAGAGTGKTTILITRLCYLILGKDIAIDKIIALTFTEKAASEIKIRLLLKMQQILADLDRDTPQDAAAQTLLSKFGKTKDELRKNIQNTFELAERAQISTIHSFCLKILRRYPLEAGLAPGADVDGGQILQTIFDKQWAAFLEQELAQDSPTAPAWARLLASASLEEIKDFANALLTPGYEDYHPLAAASQAQAACLAARAKAQDLLARYCAKKRALETALEAAANILEQSANYFGAPNVSTPLPSFSAEGRESAFSPKPAKPKDWEPEDYEEALSLLAFASDMQIANQRLILNAFNCVAPFARAMREQLRGQNILSFDDIIERTRALLKTNKTVRAELKTEYQAILIDEFQDTDPAQGEILLFLAESEQSAADNWVDIKLQHGKLFTVGDPKQSIYRFRGADITAYQKFTDLMSAQNAHKCFLQANFRSSKQIIAFANHFGARAVKEAPGVQPEYVPIACGRDLPGLAVTLAAITPPEGGDKANINDYRHNQAQFIAAWIKDNVAKTKLASGKAMAYKDIAILLRSTTALDIYTAALKRFDIKYTVEESKNFYCAQEVSNLINLLKTINDPYDKTALLGVLRSPFGLLGDDDILTLSQTNLLNIFAPAPHVPAAEAVYKTLRALHQKAGRVTLDALLAQIIYNTALCPLETLAGKNEQIIANIHKFAALARGAAAQKAMTLGQFLYYAENYSKQQNKEGESPLADESLDTVSIMTMHKAKGLEFPVVILADISKKETVRSDMRPRQIYGWQANLRGLRLGPAPDAAFTLLEKSSRRHRAAEEARVLYVAMTRAKEQQLIVGDLKDKPNTIAAMLQAAGCWPGAEHAGDTILSGDAQANLLRSPLAPPDVFWAARHASAGQEAYNFDIAAWRAARKLREQEYQTHAPAPAAPSADESAPSGQGGGAAIIGTLCHRMACDIFAGTQSAAYKDLPLTPAQRREAEQIIKIFTQTQIYAKLKAMRLLAAELPFAIYDGQNNLISGFIDAVFEDSKGKLFIADYKTDTIFKGVAPYARQLQIYKTALAQMCPGKKITAAVIYLRTGEEACLES